MMWWYSAGNQWWPMFGMLAMLVFWIAFFFLAAWLIRSYARPSQPGDSALETLRRRLAAGEITPDEFERTKKVLQG